MRRQRIDGAKIVSLRDAAWITQKELAEKAGVAEHTINRLENEHTPYPHKTTVLRIAKALDVHPNELIKHEGGVPLVLAHSSFPDEMQTLLPTG